MSTYEYQNQINELIQQEISLSNRLLENLLSENQALSSNDHEVIQGLLANKQQIIGTLESLGKQRELVLKKTGFSGDKNGMKKLIKQSGDTSNCLLGQNWRQLMAIVSECQRQNEINGIIINASSRYTTYALSILKGQQPGDNVRYGSKGETIHNTYTNPLAKA
jgi:flagellar biosynthesis/type III secretory pathway chaperone